MNTDKLLPFIAGCLLSFACTPKADKAKSGGFPMPSDKDATVLHVVPGQDTLKLSHLVKSIDLIPLETKPESMFSTPATVCYEDGRFYILDRSFTNSIALIFNADGSFVGRIGAKGRGRGEYLNPNAIAIDRKNRNVLIFDHSIDKMFRYGLDGKYISTTDLELDFVSFVVTDNAAYYQTSKYNHMNPDSSGYWVAEITAVMQDNPDSLIRYCQVNQEVYNPNKTYAFSFQELPFCRLSDSYTFHYEKSLNIFRIDQKTDQISVKYKIDFGDIGYKEDLAWLSNPDASEYKSKHPEEAGEVKDVVETDSLLLFKYWHNESPYMYALFKSKGESVSGPFVNDILDYYPPFTTVIDGTTLSVLIPEVEYFESLHRDNVPINGLDKLDSPKYSDCPFLIIYHF
jgi:hypothetical protein